MQHAVPHINDRLRRSYTPGNDDRPEDCITQTTSVWIVLRAYELHTLGHGAS